MIDPTPFIRSYVPGRLRLRHSSLIGLECDARGALTSAVKSVPGITACVVNPKVGSLFLTWDAEKLTKDDLLGYLQFWAAFSPEDAQGGVPCTRRSRRLAVLLPRQSLPECRTFWPARAVRQNAADNSKIV